MDRAGAKTLEAFAALFAGRTDARGLGKAGVRRHPVTMQDYLQHTRGVGQPLGVFPVRDDNTVWFAAVDIDEPDLALATMIQGLIPGPAYIEESPSGNYHVWCFFPEPIEAWVARAVLRAITEAVGRRDIEIFPKQERLREGQVGNYIQLPYFGTRTAVEDWSLAEFVGAVERCDPWTWETRAHRVASPPEEREVREHGTGKTLHCCAEYIITNRETNPIGEGGRHVVFFNLAKMLLDYEQFDTEECWYYMNLVNDAAPAPLPPGELRRTFDNAHRGGYTSFGCDEPLMAPYVDPQCPILKGARKNARST